MGYMMDPMMTVGVSGEERSALIRVAEAALDQETARWLAGLEPDEMSSDGYKARFGDLADRLIGIVEDWGLGENIIAGDVSPYDAAVFAGLLSHVLQRHVKVESIVDGSIRCDIDDVRRCDFRRPSSS